jgi:DNA mismatch repair protein MutL
VVRSRRSVDNGREREVSELGLIRVLDVHLSNQIAAGEVVERPSSVVKELVENAIDAGSSRIEVMVEEGGLQLIRITDNGAGMDAEDCQLAFSRHATSKIATSKDLFQIRTLGFRGEALPSIAAVAKISCTTAREESGLGTRLRMEGGEVTALEETAAPRGTDIVVKDLFYNTPARLKYMKTVQTEMSHISDYLYRLALSYPNIAFSLRHNSNLLLQTAGKGDLLQVIASIWKCISEANVEAGGGKPGLPVKWLGV